MTHESTHVEEREGTYYVRGQRVPLSGIIYDWKNGASPETIADNFPILSLVEVYGAITFYLDHRQELNEHFAQLREQEREILAQAEKNRSEWSRDLRHRMEVLTHMMRENVHCP
jgi:uncharacterized protein (DUF433 family)